MSSKLVFQQSLRRIKPERFSAPLQYRDRGDLPFLLDASESYPNLLLDTTIYIDALHGALELEVLTIMGSAQIWHSVVTEAELSATAGLLDPLHPGTAHAVAEVAELLNRRLDHRILSPDREIWREAGILAGLLARLQRYSKHEHRKTLNDALIYLTAAKHGCAVLTRNIKDFDLLMQLDGRGRAVFYERT